MCFPYLSSPPYWRAIFPFQTPGQSLETSSRPADSQSPPANLLRDVGDVGGGHSNMEFEGKSVDENPESYQW